MSINIINLYFLKIKPLFSHIFRYFGINAILKVMKSKKKSIKSSSKETTLSVKERYDSKIQSGKIGSLHQYRISVLKNYCQDRSIKRQDLTKRRNSLAKEIGIKLTKLREMYTYGTGTPENWDTIMEILNKVDQEWVKSFYINNKFSEKNLEFVPSNIQRIIKNLYKLPPLGRIYFDRLLETAITIDNESRE